MGFGSSQIVFSPEGRYIEVGKGISPQNHMLKRKATPRHDRYLLRIFTLDQPANNFGLEKGFLSILIDG